MKKKEREHKMLSQQRNKEIRNTKKNEIDRGKERAIGKKATLI